MCTGRAKVYSPELDALGQKQDLSGWIRLCHRDHCHGGSRHVADRPPVMTKVTVLQYYKVFLRGVGDMKSPGCRKLRRG